MKVFTQVLFWIMVIVLLTLLFGSRQGSYAESFYFTSMLLPIVVGTAYFFNDFLVPRYLFEKKLLKFALYTFYMLIISVWLEVLVVLLALVLLANYQYQNMHPVSTNVSMLALSMYCIVLAYGFIRLVLQLMQNQQTLQELAMEQEKQKVAFLSVRVDRKTSKIPRDEIEYLESLGDYVKIYTSEAAPIITKEKISHLAEKLPAHFLRIHRSYIVNSQKIQTFTKEEVQLKSEVQLPISRTYKKRVAESLDQKV